MLFRFLQHATRLRDLEEEVRELKSTMKHIELEWEDVFDKIRGVMGKLAKRAARDAEEADQSELPLDQGDRLSAQIRASRHAPRLAKEG